MKAFGNVDKFLERFQNMALPNEAIRKGLLGIIKDETGINVDFKDISVRNNVAYIKCGSVTKSEIFLNKKNILTKLEEMTKKGEIVDIR